MHEHDLPPFSHGLNGWFMAYVRRYLRRHFHALRLLRGEPPGPDHPDLAGQPVIFYANHPSWWDPLVFLTIGELLYPVGVMEVQPRLQIVLGLALTGGCLPSGEMKPTATTTPEIPVGD